MTAFAITGPFGTSFTTVTAGTTTDGENAKWPLGLEVEGSDGARRRYVQAGEAIAQYNWVCINQADQATKMTKTNVDGGLRLGVASDVGFSDNDIGWVVVDGPCTAKIAAACAANVNLYTTATAGLADDTSASQTLLRGCIATVLGNTNSTSNRACLLTNASSTAAP